MGLKRKYIDLLAGIVVIGFAIFLYAASFGMRSFAAAQIEPQFVPRLTAYALFLLGAAIIVKWALMKYRGTLPEDEEQKEKPSILSLITPPLTFVLLFMYLFFMRRIGFTLSTALYLAIQITLLSGVFNRREIIKNSLISVFSAGIIFFVFSRWFWMPLPVGPWGF